MKKFLPQSSVVLYGRIDQTPKVTQIKTNRILEKTRIEKPKHFPLRRLAA